MPSLESSIDSLYQGPLEGFVAARTALAKMLTGDDARRVKQLQKPTAVPWALNQVYWHARPVYDRVVKSGGTLRTAQIAALGGRSADVRGATDAHRAAVARAVAEALRLASAAGLHPSADALSRAFEAVSLATAPTEPAGRLSKALEPAGFEALAGVTVKAPAHVPVERQATEPGSTKPTGRASSPRLVDDTWTRQRQEAAAERRKSAAIKKAQGAVARAQSVEAQARADWERRKRALEVAEQALARLRDR